MLQTHFLLLTLSIQQFYDGQIQKLKIEIEQKDGTIKELAAGSDFQANEAMKKQVIMTVGKEAFADAKFVADEDQLYKLGVKCYYIIFPDEQQQSQAHMAKWIATYKDIMRQALNTKRNDGQSAARVVFTLRLCRCTVLLPRIEKTFLTFCSFVSFLLLNPLFPFGSATQSMHRLYYETGERWEAS